MLLEIKIEPNENFDNLTLASAIIGACAEKEGFQNSLNAVKVAKAILLEMVGGQE